MDQGASSSDMTNPQRVTFGCPVLDSKLGGGLPCKSVTELVGEAGVGKTQICIQQSMAVQLPFANGGLFGSAYYIYTEGRFPYRRLDQLQQSFDDRFCNVIGHRWWEKVFIHQIDTPTKLIEEFSNIENHLALQAIENMPVRLLVVDSITALFRGVYDCNAADFEVRSELLTQITKKLKRWAIMFNLAVIVTNQVSSFIPSENNYRRWEGLMTSGERVCPATALSRTGYVSA
jgi:RecA/RadA recombinase